MAREPVRVPARTRNSSGVSVTVSITSGSESEAIGRDRGSIVRVLTSWPAKKSARRIKR